MAGTIFGLGLSQQIQADGEPYGGCLLYIYEGGTTTPTTVYKDYALTTGQEHAFPIEADAAGRIPAFWVNDGTYDVLLTDSDGNTIISETSITALGPSVGATYVETSIDSNALFQTGFTFWSPVDSVSFTGYVRLNGRSIGSVSSGATERASSDTEDLFGFLWTNLADSEAAVSGGRGASSAADFAANKKITLPDLRGRAPWGLDTMGNIAAGRLSGVSTPGESGGAASVTIAETNLPAHTHAAGTLTVGSHTHSVGTLAVSPATHTHGAGTLQYLRPYDVTIQSGSGALVMNDYDGEGIQTNLTGDTASESLSITGASAAASPAVDSGVTGSVGSGTALTTVSPYLAGTWYIKL